MLVEAVSGPGGSNENEDWFGVDDNVAVVLDGATTRTETGCIHGVAWYVSQLGRAVLRLAADGTRSLESTLYDAIYEVASMHSACDLVHPGSPSAAVGIIRVSDLVIESLVLADVTIVVSSKSGEVRAISDNRPDLISRHLLHDAWVLPLNSVERQRALVEAKEHQLKMRNIKGGYYVASAEPSVAQFALTGTWDLSGTESIMLLTDGAARLVDTYRRFSWGEIVELVRAAGVGEMLRLLRDIEAMDFKAERWPRSKVSDDATIAFIAL